MSIITLPSRIKKNEFLTFGINKTDIAAIPAVVGDLYYSDLLNWKKVVLTFTSYVGNQTQFVSFDVSDNNIGPSYNGISFFSEKARAAFSLTAITIHDFDGGRLKLNRASVALVAAGTFDIIFSSGGSSVGYFPFTTTGGGSFPSMQTFLDPVDNDYAYIMGNDATFKISAGVNVLATTFPDWGYDSITNYLNDPYITSCVVTEDGTKAYVSGVFGNRYRDSNLPVSTYSNAMRIVSVDLADGTIEHICDFGYSSATGYTHYITQIQNSIIVGNMLVVRGSDKMSAIDLTTKTIAWTKPIVAAPDYGNFYSASFGNSMKKHSGSIYTVSNSYDDIAFNISSVIKINPETGERDISFSQHFIDTRAILSNTYVESVNGGNFVIADDGTVYASTLNNGGSNSGIVRYGTDGVSLVRGGYQQNNAYNVGLLGIHNGKLFYAGMALFGGNAISADSVGVHEIHPVTLDSLGRVIPLNSLYGMSPPFGYGAIKYHAGKLYYFDGATYKRYSLDTFSLEAQGPAIAGAIRPDMQVIDDKFIFQARGPAVTNVIYSNISSVSLVNPILRLNLVTKEIDGFTNDASGANFVNPPCLHPTQPKKLITVNDNAVRVYSLTNSNATPTPAYEAGWPTWTSQTTPSFSVKGNFLYVSSMRSDPNGNRFILSDTNGSFTSNSGVVRINLTTKIIDRTFNPTIPNITQNFDGTQIKVTSNYVYVRTITTTAYQTFTQKLYQIKMSDLSVIDVDLAANNIDYTSIDIYGSAVITSLDFEVFEIGSGHIVFCRQKKGSTFFGGSRTQVGNYPFVVLNESTLSVVSTPHEGDNILAVCYNEFDNCLYGYLTKDTATVGYTLKQYIKYDPNTGTRTLLGGSLASSVESINELDTAGRPMFARSAEEFYIVINGMINRKPVLGLEKFSPFPPIISG